MTSILPKKFEYLKNRVAIVKLDDYKPENVSIALKSVIDLIGIKDYFNNKSIFLKPNALAPSKDTFTPLEITSELVKILKKEAGVKKILVGDSTMTKGFTSFTFKKTKYIEMCEDLGVNLVNLFENDRIKVKISNPAYDIEECMYLPKDICDSDLVINLPKLKTHKGYVYTGAIKNFFGLLTNKMKMHTTHKNKNDFQKMLADIYFAVEETNNTIFPKVFTIMDGVKAMEGKGPRAGKPRKIGVLIAGFNSAAVDIVGYTLMNGKPSDLEAINSLAKRTALLVDISQLEIVGETNFNKLIVKNFKKPSIATLKEVKSPKKGPISKIRSNIIHKMVKISIKIKSKKCTLCEECVKHCPAEAMVRKKDKIQVEHNKCIECYCCGEICPNDAINAKLFGFKILPLLILIFIGGISLFIWFLIQFIILFF